MKYYTEQRDIYKIYYEYEAGIITEYPDSFINVSRNEDIDELYQKYLLYDFYVNTEIPLVNFVHVDNLSSNIPRVGDGTFQILSSKISFYIIAILSIIVTIMHCCVDYNSGQIKNQLQSPMKEKNMLFGKILYSILIIILVTVLLIITVLIVSKCANHYYVVNVLNDKIETTTTLAYFIAKMLINMMYGILIILMTVSLMRFIKNPYLLGFTSVSIIALFFGIEAIINEIIDGDEVNETVRQFIFFANSQTQTISFRSVSLYLIIGSTVVISSLLVLIINKCVLGCEKSAFQK